MTVRRWGYQGPAFTVKMEDCGNESAGSESVGVVSIFKIPINVELIGPYLDNGRKAILEQAFELYDDSKRECQSDYELKPIELTCPPKTGRDFEGQVRIGGQESVYDFLKMAELQNYFGAQSSTVDERNKASNLILGAWF